jgi:N-acetylmuramoyl-L-alanine amidase
MLTPLNSMQKKYKKTSCSVLVAIVVILCATANQRFGQAMPLEIRERLIVIDPGHGGSDTGVKSADGRFEKQVTLALARVLQTRLQASNRVHLTRSGDYELDLFARTAIANHLKADVFISLHTGGSFLHQAGGMTIFYHQKAVMEQENAPSIPIKISKNDLFIELWSDIARKNRLKSKLLSETILNFLINIYQSSPINIKGVPLIVLEGADMPAVLIEIGYLSNPVDESKLYDENGLSQVADAICEALGEYFKKINHSF